MDYDNKVCESRDKIFKNSKNTCINDAFFERIFRYLKENDKVLDLGTGNGYVLSRISKSCKFKVELYGNDNSEIMLSKAKKNLENATFELCSNYKLNFKSNYFDMVVAKNVTRFSAKEIERVLKPEGIFVYREYGKYKGLVEVSKLFSGRLIRSRNKSFYDRKLRVAQLRMIESQYVNFVRVFKNVADIIETVQAYPYISNFNQTDVQILKNRIKGTNIPVHADGILLVYQKEKRNV